MAKKTKEMYKEFVDHLYDGVYFVDTRRKITYWNKSAERLTGYLEDEIVGRHCYDNLLDHCDAEGNHLCHNGCPLHATIQDGQLREADVFLRQKNGIRRPVSVRVAPVYDDHGELAGAVEIFSDNSSKLAVIEELQVTKDMAYLDELTRICNRRSMAQYFQSKINDFQAKKFPFGVAMLDVDHFKNVNDTYGHDAGDKILKMVADVLSSTSRSFDVVARWGGEEFMVLFANVNESLLKKIAERQRMLIEKSRVLYEGAEINITISIGITLFNEDDDQESVIKRCDDLLYQAKEAGRNQVQFG